MRLGAPDTMPPLARPPPPARLRPLAPRAAGTRSFGPKCPHVETSLALEGPAELGTAAANAACSPLETAEVTFDLLHSNGGNKHLVNINSDTFDE